MYILTVLTRRLPGVGPARPWPTACHEEGPQGSLVADGTRVRTGKGLAGGTTSHAVLPSGHPCPISCNQSVVLAQSSPYLSSLRICPVPAPSGPGLPWHCPLCPLRGFSLKDLSATRDFFPPSAQAGAGGRPDFTSVSCSPLSPSPSSPLPADPATWLPHSRCGLASAS